MPTQCAAISHLAPELQFGDKRSGSVGCFFVEVFMMTFNFHLQNQLVLSITKYFLRKLIQGSATAFEFFKSANLVAVERDGLDGLICRHPGALE